MKLIREQAELLIIEKQQLQEEITNTKDSIEKTAAGPSLNGAYNEPHIEMTKQIAVADRRIREIENILRMAQIVDVPSTGKIDIGSRVEMFIDFGDNVDFKEDNYLSVTLIEEKVGKESSEKFITKESQIGKAIFGKEKGDQFSYRVNGVQRMNGIIMDVEYEKSTILEEQKVAKK